MFSISTILTVFIPVKNNGSFSKTAVAFEAGDLVSKSVGSQLPVRFTEGPVKKAL